MPTDNQETIIVEEQPQQTTNENFNPFADEGWTETKPEPVQQAEAVPAPGQKAEAATETDYNKYVKEKFGFDSEDELRQRLEATKDVKFDNEQSEKFFNLLREGKEDDVYQFLENKRRIDRLTSSPVDNAQVAAEILKLSIQSKYSDLSADEIARKFEKQFPIPPKPQQTYDQTDDEYAEVVSQWEAQKELSEKDLIIEAKIAKKELDSLKAELKLPDIQTSAATKQPTQEDLQKVEALRKSYESALEEAYKSFDGFKVTAKSEDAELPIAFVPTEQEKSAFKERLFDFDATEYLDGRWVKEDGTVDANKAMRDLYLLENAERIFQKIANETAAKTLEAYIKSRSNLSLNNTGTLKQPQFENTSVQERQVASIWEA